MKHVLTASLVLVLASACSAWGGRHIPDFANPKNTHGFKQLAHGSGAEKEPSTVWIFAGNVPFADWKRDTSDALTSHGWSVGPDESNPDSAAELLASSADGESCLNYYDLGGSTRMSKYHRDEATFLTTRVWGAPSTMERAKEFETAILVAALACP